MSRETQLQKQFPAWITKGRWDALLKWFNQSPPQEDAWSMFFEAARGHGMQNHWPKYMEFLQGHVTNALSSVSFLSYQQQKAIQDERAWSVLSLALPHFFIKALPLLDESYRQEQTTALLDMLAPWLPNPKDSYSIVERGRGAIVLGLLVNAGAYEQWKEREVLFDAKFDPTPFLKYVVDKDIRWTHMLRERYFASVDDEKAWRNGRYDGGGADKAWRNGLFQCGAIEQLALEPGSYPVARMLLEKAVDEQQRPRPTADDALMAVFTRYPRLRLWIELGPSDDAQVCRAALSMSKHEASECYVAKSLTVARDLGVPLAQWALLLDTPTLQETYSVSSGMFEYPIEGPNA